MPRARGDASAPRCANAILADAPTAAITSDARATRLRIELPKVLGTERFEIALELFRREFGLTLLHLGFFGLHRDTKLRGRRLALISLVVVPWLDEQIFSGQNRRAKPQ